MPKLPQHLSRLRQPRRRTRVRRRRRFYGDTGLWFVPTAEVLAHGKWSGTGVSAGHELHPGLHQRRRLRGHGGGRDQGPRGSVRVVLVRHADRSRRAADFSSPTPSSAASSTAIPRVNKCGRATTWATCTSAGRSTCCRSTGRHKAAVAVRGMVKIPTGDDDVGTSTGKADLLVDFIASKDVAKIVDVAGYAGYECRGSPDGFDIPGGAFRWGGGLGFPSRSPLRIQPSSTGSCCPTTRRGGRRPAGGRRQPRAVPGQYGQHHARDGSRLPFRIERLFLGGGLSWNVPRERATRPSPKQTRRRLATTGTGRCASAITRGSGVCAAAAAAAARRRRRRRPPPVHT